MDGLGSGKRMRRGRWFQRASVVLVASAVTCLTATPVFIGVAGGAAVATDVVTVIDPDGAAGDRFGWSVDLDGGRLLVGAPFDDATEPALMADSGSMTGFAAPDWTVDLALECVNDVPLGDLSRYHCGWAVAIEGDMTVMGAPQWPQVDPFGALRPYGAVIVTDWSGQEPVHVVHSGYASTSFYGAAVDRVDGATALGAPWTRYWVGDNPVELVGEARILGSDWLQPPDLVADLEFGRSIALQGGLVAIGATGSAFVYQDATGWGFVQEIVRGGDAWLAVALDEGTLVIGSRDETTAGGATGLAAVYTWNGAQFVTPQTLAPPAGGDGDEFGRAVAIDGDRIVVGAPYAGAGVAHVYERIGAVWQLEATLTAPDGASDDRFGWSVAIAGSTVAVGAPNDDNGNGTDAGTVYVFDLDASPPTTTTTTTTTAPGGSGTFVDDDGSIFEPDIEWLAAAGITKGCNPPDNTMFCPADPVTRAQMAAFLVRALGYHDDGGGGLFVDTVGSIFATDIDKLATAGVTKGCNPPLNNKYCPASLVTRAQMAAFLVRALGYHDDGGGGLFVDTVGSIFATDIDKLATAGVTKGCNPPLNNKYCPGNPVTRAQMAAFLHRALGS